MRTKLYVVIQNVYKCGEFAYSCEIFFTSRKQAKRYANKIGGKCIGYGASKVAPSKHYFPTLAVDISRGIFTDNTSEYDLALKYGYIRP